MATDKKHIAVYLAPGVELALIAFCQQKGLISKKGTMFSAGVNAALAQFFGIADTRASNTPLETNNIPQETSNIPIAADNISQETGNIPIAADNIPQETGNIPIAADNIPQETGNIPIAADNIPCKSVGNILIHSSNIPAKSLAVEGLPGKFQT